MLESEFQANLIKKIEDRLPGCIVLKNDPKYKRGIPDLLVLYEHKWAALECKKHTKASHRPNQDYYIVRMNKMSFARFIRPENEEEVLNEMEHTLKSSRTTRFPRRKQEQLVELRRRQVS